MSGIALLYNRQGRPAERSALEPSFGTLSHHGPDGTDIYLNGPLALGHQHFWITGEELDERQPLSDARGSYTVALDGRLDNRAELVESLEIRPGEGLHLSDAMLVLRAYAHWHQRCFERFLGTYAIVIYDAQRRQVLLARDHLGDRTLFYHLTDQLFVVASEEQAVLAHPAVSRRLNQRSLAYYFAVQPPAEGETLFEAVAEVPPASVLIVGESTVQTWRYWVPRVEPISYRSDREYAEHFRDLLDRSVRRCLRGAKPPAVLMSGGLDSTSIVALATRALAEASCNEPLHTISCLFDELPECDEREWIDAMDRSFDTRPVHLVCDGDWPLCDHTTLPHNPNGPDRNPFRPLKLRGYDAARALGNRSLIIGAFGDSLYSGVEDWLADLLSEGRIGEAIWQTTQHARQRGLARTIRTPWFYRLAGRLIDRWPALRAGVNRYSRRHPDWLTTEARALLPDENPLNGADGPAGRRAQLEALIGRRSARSMSGEIYYASIRGIELRDPYRDPHLIEYMLSIPAHQFYWMGWGKYILRNAMRGILPESVRLRYQVRNLGTLFDRGLADRERQTAQAILAEHVAEWRGYVREDWVHARLAGLGSPAMAGQGRESIALWNCISFALWRQRESERLG